MFFDLDTAFRDLSNLRREIDSVFNRTGYTGRNSFPLVNLYETSEDLKLVAELPGLTRENIDITLHNDTLTLKGHRDEKNYGEKVTALRQERSTGQFTKDFRLPIALEKDKISATFSDGMLTITIPKAEEAKPKKIMIQA